MKTFENDAVREILPHRPPFLFVDRVTQLAPGRSIVAERLLRADEPQFAGHFPQRAIMPGVLVTEALAQTSGLLLGLSRSAAQPAGAMFYLATSNMKFLSPAVPGETLTLRAESERDLGRLSRFAVEAAVGKRLVATGTITLAMVEGAP
ncbi:MAG TPA: 3-hydroxyacyl-ACP dehydratase FabZ [Verrucomicrobiae bacterium]|nr:3-hydroxyacyl-ACP dehydratase FabZ [Verrucomicrobiae bacterium]